MILPDNCATITVTCTTVKHTSLLLLLGNFLPLLLLFLPLYAHLNSGPNSNFLPPILTFTIIISSPLSHQSLPLSFSHNTLPLSPTPSPSFIPTCPLSTSSHFLQLSLSSSLSASSPFNLFSRHLVLYLSLSPPPPPSTPLLFGSFLFHLLS